MLNDKFSLYLILNNSFAPLSTQMLLQLAKKATKSFNICFWNPDIMYSFQLIHWKLLVENRSHVCLLFLSGRV